MTTTTVHVSVPGGSYAILLGEGLLDQLPELVARCCPAEHYAVLTDSTVASLYGRQVARALERLGRASLITFPAGEWNKTRETWARLTDRMLEAGVGRDGAVVALGGGVVGDLAGFVAATYLRGVPYVQVPTTLLAMIDSSIGGKTGVDTPAGKNLVGVFHQPRLVVADLATLRTLPRPQVAAGMAEAIKHGAIADAGYFAELGDLAPRVFQADIAALRRVVERSVAIKAAVVAEDERERGRRAILNFGHTVAHALEATSGYELLHGEAVAVGLVAEAALGARLGITRPEAAGALRSTVSAYGLPTELPRGTDAEALLAAMQQDKKVRRGSVRFALLEEIGRMHQASGWWTVEVPEPVIRAALGGASTGAGGR